MRTSDQLLLRGYGPLVGFSLLLVLMALLVPTVDAERAAVDAPGEAAADGGGSPGAEPGAPPATPGDQDGGAPEPGGDDVVGGAPPASEPDDAGPTDAEQAAEGDDAEARQAASGVQPCDDRDWQVPGDPYSPPCVTFEGDNGGATHRGVTADEIVITARVPEGSDAGAALAEVAGAEISDTREDTIRTIEALVEYVNDRFEFYGRELRVEFYTGSPDAGDESLGGGQEGAMADALHVAEDVGAFAELKASSAPFGDALAQQGVIGFGAPHLSREWMSERAPYAWSIAVDCSTISESASDFGIKRLVDRDAEFAGPEFRDQQRRTVILAPDNPIYQECVGASIRAYEEAGVQPPDTMSYQLDATTLLNQATNLAAQLQANGYTTVQCSCDPILPVFLTSRAEEQGYEPEWVITGTALMDQDIVGQLMQQDQWSRAFGISYSGRAMPFQESLGYSAYKQVRDDEPARAVALEYYNLYLLAIGIQGAGPNLTPETFQQGMFDYPGGEGPAGIWAFGPENHTTAEDFREIYWDPREISVYNSEPGAFIETDPGVRHRRGELPDGPPRLPR
jgi:hypothetical protein